MSELWCSLHMLAKPSCQQLLLLLLLTATAVRQSGETPGGTQVQSTPVIATDVLVSSREPMALVDRKLRKIFYKNCFCILTFYTIFKNLDSKYLTKQLLCEKRIKIILENILGTKNV